MCTDFPFIPVIPRLDPLSAYLSEDELQRLLYSPGDGSIGLALKQSDLGAEVVSVIDESPGAKADISVGTLIVAIDGKPTALMPLQDVTSALRGPEGSVVSLELAAAESSEVVRREVRRERIRQTSISARVMDGQLGYVRVTQLGASLANELAEALHLMLILQLQPVKGIIVDMRDCPGGLLHAAIALAAAFLPDDAVVIATASRIEGELTYRARQSDTSSKDFDSNPIFGDKALRAAAQKIPLVVLVNHGTTSGAEAVAAALQDTGRAHIIGQATAGIGSVQSVLPMNGHGAIRLTTSVMRSASGRSWNEQGVRPDFPMLQVPRARQAGKTGSDPWIDFAAEQLAKR